MIVGKREIWQRMQAMPEWQRDSMVAFIKQFGGTGMVVTIADAEWHWGTP